MTQEAMKLALEKIATVNAMDYEYQAWAREALAQTQEPKIGCVNHDCEKCKAQTQEPVAYLTRRKIGGTEGLLRADMVDRSAKNQETHDFIPLYTAPPQQEQEPVGVVHHKLTSTLGADYEQVAVFVRPLEPLTKLYTAPPQRTWVGLTEEEFKHYCSWIYPEILNEIENKLKENNT